MTEEPTYSYAGLKEEDENEVLWLSLLSIHNG